MAITPLPTPPSRSDPANFSDRADTFLGALDTWTAQVNATATAVALSETNASYWATQANNAKTSAQGASASADSQANMAAIAASSAQEYADSALNAPGTNATSTTSLAIGTGSKSLTLAQTGKAFSLGQTMVIAYTTDPTQNMVGVITAFNSGTGAMTVNVSSVSGSGTYATWTVSLTATSAVISVNGSTGAITGLATVTGAETLTNKTLTSPVINTPNIRLNTSYINTSTTAVAGRSYAIDANISLTLPSSPTAGDTVMVQTLGSYLTAAVLRNGQNIMSLAQDLTLDQAYATITLIYIDSTRGWVIAR